MTAGADTPEKSMDWVGLRQRLKETLAATETSFVFSPERVREIMDKRARALALATDQRDEGERIPIVTFGLGNEIYGIEARYVREVDRLSDYTPLPDTPDFVIGVTNLRGRILTLVDLRRFLNIRSQGLSDLSHVVFVGETQAEFGILAEVAHQLVEVRDDELQAAPEAGAPNGDGYVRGIGPDRLIVLDGAAVLADERLFIGRSGTASVQSREQ